MYIEALTLDGFKSYSKRTRIDDWDPYFNAITGMNGSGKSNLLDAICFVLGISNLVNVRASNFLDLVYKRGQAGISRASATIVFNNENRAQSPPGYEDSPKITVTRQIVVNGRNKYIINGHVKSQQDVTMLFHSVQLNVNNPHFLIMQGKITQVLNMKPREVLSVIEEASGTRMFEDRKLKAIGTLEKKDAKLQETYSLLETEIEPKLFRLKEEKRNLLEYQKIESELSQMKKLIKVHEYANIASKIEKHADTISRNQAHLDFLESQSFALQQEQNALLESLGNFAEDISKDSENLEEHKEILQERYREYTKLNAQLGINQTSVNEEQKILSKVKKDSAESKTRLERLNTNIRNLKNNINVLKEEDKNKSSELSRLDELIQYIKSGNSSESTKHQQRIRDLRDIIDKSTLEINTSSAKIEYIKEKLSTSEKRFSYSEKQHSILVANLSLVNAEIKNLKTELENTMWDPEQREILREESKNLERKVYGIKMNIEDLESKLNFCNFQYTPHEGLDASKVKGVVADMFRLKPGNSAAAYALEACAGAKLFNVIIQDEITGSQLIKYGNLKKRYTFIPLNKIQQYHIHESRINAARKISPDAKLALDLTEYDPALEPAMKYVFGSTFICQDQETAKKITFNGDIRIRSITLDGDTYDPSGQLTGGSKPKSSGIFADMQKLISLRAELKDEEHKLYKAQRDYTEFMKIFDRCKDLENNIELKMHESRLLEQKIVSDPGLNIVNSVNNLKEELADQEKIIQKSLENKERAAKELSIIESDIKKVSGASNIASKIKSLKERQEECQKILVKINAEKEAAQTDLNSSIAEKAQAEIEYINANDKVALTNSSLEKLLSDNRELAFALERLTETKSAIESEKTRIENKNNIRREINKKKKMAKDIEAEKNVAKIEKEKATKALNDYQGALQRLLKEDPWLAEQKLDSSGNALDADAPFDSDVYNRIKQLEDRHKSLSKIIDRDVIDKYERVEKREARLRQMIQTVQRDKKKIQATIGELDKYKFDAVKRTWELVNKEFSDIFNEILPGSNSKLQTLDGEDITKGLEICVGLGGIWKRSLTELSGGQKSLVALSLILSLLKFRPAPIYILDEVDSALDIAHTQNIGHLLKTRFKGSQFILVSLKEGMFNNANIIFRAKFRDGHSIVEVRFSI